MSIYTTLWSLKFPRYGDSYVGCEWLEVTAKARVLWCRAGEDRGIGCRFVNLDEDTRSAIWAFVATQS